MTERPARRYERMLLDLCAVIHRDGGHYVSDHGLDKAVEDAMHVSSERIGRIDELEYALCEARDVIRKTGGRDPVLNLIDELVS